MASNQARIICNNPICREADSDDIPFFQQTVTHKQFTEVTKDAFNPYLNEEDHLAILKPTMYFCFAPRRMYIRQPNPTTCDVKILPYPDVAAGQAPDFLRPEAKAKFGRWRGGDKTLPVDHQGNLASTIRLDRAAMNGESIVELHPVAHD